MALRITKNSFHRKEIPEEENYHQEKFDKPWTIKDFDIGKRLGRGSKGWVFLAREKRSADQMLVAIKILNKSRMDSDSLKRLTSELINHRSVEHDNIIKFYCWFEDEEKFYIVLEYAYRGDLFEQLNNGDRISEQTAATYIFQLANALKYLHSRNVIHRDIKPENIMIDACGNLRLGDFGWSIKCTGRRKTLCGTPEYIAPEMIANKEYDYRADIWSLGVLCYELLIGSTPFKGENDKETYDKIVSFDSSQTKFTNISKNAKDLILKMLKMNYHERISIDEILNHSWIVENAIKEKLK